MMSTVYRHHVNKEVRVAVPKSVITDAELNVLRLLWEQPDLAARQITERLYPSVSQASLGTVQKLLARLEAKELILRDRAHLPHRFAAAVTREGVAGLQLEEFATKLSDGSLSPFVMHLVRARRLSRQEKEEIRKLLDSDDHPEDDKEEA